MTLPTAAPRRLRSRWIATVAILGIAGLALVEPSSAAYRDDAHARTPSLAATQTPVMRAGMSSHTQLLDTGLGLSPSGVVYVWGRTGATMNGGAPDGGPERPPQAVPFPIGTQIRQVTGQLTAANALDSAGQVWGWGIEAVRNGTDVATTSGAPQRLRIDTAWNGAGAILTDIMEITATDRGGAGIRADGTIWHWGLDSAFGSNLAYGATRVTGLPDPTIAGNRPVFLRGTYSSYFVILENGLVYYWGGAGLNSLPPGTPGAGEVARRLTALDPWMRPNVPAGAPSIVALDGGSGMGAALLSDGRVLSWGTDQSRTGRGLPTAPTVISTLRDIRSLQFGYTLAVFVDASGSLWAYGASTDVGRNAPFPVLLSTNVVQVQVGAEHALWQRADGTFWARGRNALGALGLPSGTQIAPRQVLWPANQNRLSVVAL